MEFFFSIKEPVFKELCVEFYLTIYFEADMVDPHFTTTLVFRYGGQYRECSFTEFACINGIYEQHEVMSLIFHGFFRLAA